MQIECRKPSLLELYAEMQLIFCKDTKNENTLHYLGGYFSVYQDANVCTKSNTICIGHLSSYYFF